MKLYMALLTSLAALSQALPAGGPNALEQLNKSFGMQADDVAKLSDDDLEFLEHEFPDDDWPTFEKQFPNHHWEQILKDLLRHNFAQVDHGPGKDWVRTGKKNDWLCPPGKVKEGGIDCYWTGTFVDPTKDNSGPSCSSRGGQYKKVFGGGTGVSVKWGCSV